MTDAPALSAANQQAVLAEVARAQKDNKKNAALKLLGIVAGVAAYAVFSALLPPAGAASLPAAASAVTAALCGFSLLQNAGRAHQLNAVKENAGKEGFFDKLKARAAKLSKWHGRADGIWGIGLLAAVGVVVAAWAAPAVISGAVASATYSALIYASLGAMAVTNALRGSRDTATALTGFTDKAISGVQPAAPANDKQPAAPALATAPSPAAGFDKAANNNAPPPAEPAPQKSAPAAPKTPAA